ncbi:MAG: ATP-binding protein [Polyangiales bacterium]
MSNLPHELLAHLIDGVVDETARRLGDGPTTPAQVRQALVDAVDEVLAPVAPRLERLARLAEVGVRAATVGHELRNPLSVIETSLFLLGEKNADPRTARLLRRISEQVSASTAIINELLDGARPRDEVRAPLDLADIADYALEAVPRPAHVSVERDLPRGVARVLGDPRRLRQVAVNLLNNAVRATRDRTPSGVVALKVSAADDRAALAVLDDGPGIAFPERLFELLHTTHAEGLGIGLALSRRIVAEHGGTLTGGNREGGGAWFRVELPLHRVEGT